MWLGDKLNNRNRAGLLTKKDIKMVAFMRIKPEIVVQR
jgi:hypothetical protein